MKQPVTNPGSICWGNKTGPLHHISNKNVPAPFRWKCVLCGRFFKIAPNSVKVDK